MPTLQRGQPVYDPEREPPSRNGIIVDIDWEERTIYVVFHSVSERFEYPKDAFDYHWTDDFGGCWFL